MVLCALVESTLMNFCEFYHGLLSLEFKTYLNYNFTRDMRLGGLAATNQRTASFKIRQTKFKSVFRVAFQMSWFNFHVTNQGKPVDCYHMLGSRFTLWLTCQVQRRR